MTAANGAPRPAVWVTVRGESLDVLDSPGPDGSPGKVLLISNPVYQTAIRLDGDALDALRAQLDLSPASRLTIAKDVPR